MIDRIVSVIPAQAGIHVNAEIDRMDSQLRGNDGPRAIRMIINRVVSVIPAQAGIHVSGNNARLDSRLSRNDGHIIRESL